MKKLGILLMLALITIGGLFAHPGFVYDSDQPVIQVKGTLSLINGEIAVKEGDKTYYLRGIHRLAGFIDGFKEGTAVEIEGYANTFPAAPEYIFLHPTKLTLKGKTYDLAQSYGCEYNQQGYGHRGRGWGFWR